MPRNNQGYDIESLRTAEHLDFIEVKGRVAGADTFHITRSEILTALNKPRPQHPRARRGRRRRQRPRCATCGSRSASSDLPAFDDVGALRLDWKPFWERAETRVTEKRKLIEVALPLEAINVACKADKDRKTGTIRNLHKWFAPMPLPAWRALALRGARRRSR